MLGNVYFATISQYGYGLLHIANQTLVMNTLMHVLSLAKNLFNVK